MWLTRAVVGFCVVIAAGCGDDKGSVSASDSASGSSSGGSSEPTGTSGAPTEGTARHFLRHLEQYWEKTGLEGCEAGLESEAAGHHGVWCRTPLAADAAILRLKPKRRREPAG